MSILPKPQHKSWDGERQVLIGLDAYDMKGGLAAILSAAGDVNPVGYMPMEELGLTLT